MSDTRTAAGCADPVMASTYALIAIAETLEGFIHKDSGFLGVVNYPEAV